MNLRTTIAAIAGIAALALTAAGPQHENPALIGTTQVGADDLGDWGSNRGLTSDEAQAGHLLGQDLVGAYLEDRGEHVDFIIEVSYLPHLDGNLGGVPELSRYSWNFTVNGAAFDLDGKYTNYSRGACDPTSGQCDPENGKLPRDPGTQPFFLRGNCYTDTTGNQNLTLCEELAVIQADFDARNALITIPVPWELLLGEDGTKTACTEIAPDEGTFGGFLSAGPAVFVTSSLMPLDIMGDLGHFTQSFVVDAEACEAANA